METLGFLENRGSGRFFRAYLYEENRAVRHSPNWSPRRCPGNGAMWLSRLPDSPRRRLEPMREVAAMINRHRENAKAYFRHSITYAGAESMNSKIQRVKGMARGFRNRERFRMDIYFHCGCLDLYPDRAKLTQRIQPPHFRKTHLYHVPLGVLKGSRSRPRAP